MDPSELPTLPPPPAPTKAEVTLSEQVSEVLARLAAMEVRLDAVSTKQDVTLALMQRSVRVGNSVFPPAAIWPSLWADLRKGSIPGGWKNLIPVLVLVVLSGCAGTVAGATTFEILETHRSP